MEDDEPRRGGRDRIDDEVIRLRARVHELATDQHEQAMVITRLEIVVSTRQHEQALIIMRLETVVGTLKLFVYGLISLILTGVGVSLLGKLLVK